MLVNCVAYHDGRKLADIQKREIKSYLARPDCFVWVALRDADAAELAEMQDEFDLHALAVEDAAHGNQRPKIEEYGDTLFTVLHTVEVAGEELIAGEIDVFVGRNFILSVRQRTVRGFQDVRARCEREPDLLRHGSGYVLYTLMDAVVDRYFPVLDAVETELEALDYLERRPDPQDARQVLLHFTPRGEALIADSVASVDELAEEYAELIGGAPLSRLQSALQALYRGLCLEQEVFDQHSPGDIDQLAQRLRRQLGDRASRALARLLLAPTVESR